MELRVDDNAFVFSTEHNERADLVTVRLLQEQFEVVWICASGFVDSTERDRVEGLVKASRVKYRVYMGLSGRDKLEFLWKDAEVVYYDRERGWVYGQ